MTNKETHLSRGTTKEGKEVVGYAVYSKNKKEWKIITLEEKIGKEGFIGGEYFCEKKEIQIETEITSPPQKCLGIRDCEGKLIFEGDDVEIKNEKGEWKKFKVVYEKGGLEFKIDGCTCLDKNYLSEDTCEIKIIHPTNKEEE